MIIRGIYGGKKKTEDKKKNIRGDTGRSLPCPGSGCGSLGLFLVGGTDQRLP